ncbi:uncharacterized protein DUF1707 [Streptomyces sp. 3211.6]|uniref:DUF1707 SHOCT-like domain-containing protein n=1 Tax=Streptomyces TaxID=1883 RepID=UPI000F1CEA0A|nr:MULTISPECIES: DUF1707 domain-containing protein [Streptomyces]RKS96959.1 uncharacterized protein DUF1707 [Streptomyces sp. 3211.6]RPF25291.1 uncharacterized protein DUF1707 [Streptomyces sp. Ag109_G2-6]
MTESQGQEPADAEGRAAIRAADGDRDAVAERLRVAAGEGRLDLAELEERLEQTYASKTYAELEGLLADLPADGGWPGDGTLVLKTHLTAIRQSGAWVVPPRIVAECGMLNILIDFTAATCAHREVTLEASCGMGTVQVVVPDGWEVRIDPASTNTARVANRADGPVDPTAPVLTVVGHPRSGWIRIKRARR